MTPVLRVVHPGFDRLSSHADASDATATGWVARHVDECARCRATVAEIRALGADARALHAEETPPPDMLARILASPPPETAVAYAEDAVRAPAPARSPTRRRRLVLGAALAAAAALVVLVARPDQRDLSARGTSRLTFSPTRPVPGGLLTVRYQPSARLAGAPRLVLAGRYVAPAGSSPRSLTPITDVLDSLATLLPRSDGSYEGQFRLPVNFLGVRLMVFDSTGEHRDADGARSWVVIGGTRDRGPSLASLLAAYEPPVRLAYDDSAHRSMLPRQQVSVPDSLQRYFPDHPAGWALYDRYGVRKGRFDFLSFFQSAERKYASVTERLWPQRGLDADRLAYMVRFASRIEEPAEVERWTTRLVREHPEDPRALSSLAAALHAFEVRAPNAARDSIRRTLPLLDSLYARSRAPLESHDDVVLLARRYGDPATLARWTSRAGRSPSIVVYSDSVSETSESVARTLVAATCRRANGKFPIWGGARWSSWCDATRAVAWAHLARASMARGDVGAAARAIDSSLSVGEADCFARNRIFAARAEVRLAQGDSGAATDDLARAFGILRFYGNDPRRQETLQSRARAVSGAGVRTSRFAAVADSMTGEVRRCSRASVRGTGAR